MKKLHPWSRLLSIALCLCMVLSMIPGIPLVARAEAAGSYVLVTQASDILSGGQFVIVADHSGSAMALGTSISGKIDPVAVTVAGNTVIGSDLPVWTLEATASGVALNNGSSYLGYKSSTNFTSSDAAYEWGVSAGTNGGFVLNSTSATRGIYYQISGNRFGAYAQSNADTGEYISGLQLYKYTESSGETPDAPEVCTHENQTTLPGKDATCTETGLTQGTACADCGETLVAQEVIPAIPHSYADGSCTVCGAADPSVSGDTGYVLVTDISQILVGGQFVIVADNSGSALALGTSTSGKIDPVAVTVEGNTVIGSDLPVWTLEATASGVALYNGSSYLGYISSTNFASSDTAYEWGVSAGSNGGFVLNSTSATRGIYFQISGNRFGAYAQSNADNGEYISGLQLYKYTQSGSDTPDAPEACTHENQTTLPGKDATCTETGLTQGTACADCGETLVAREVIPVVEHTEEMIPGKDATCTETGLTDGSKCSVCGTTLTAQKPTPATGHSFAEGICTVCGAEDTGSSGITGYVLVTDISQILVGGQFVIVADNSGSYLALGTSTSGKIDPIAVTVADNTVIGSDLPVWTLEATTAGVALNNGTSYLGYTSSTNFASSDTAYEWGVSAGSNGGFVLNSTSATRGIYYQISGGRFGAYAQSNADKEDYISGLQLYKYTEAGSDTPDVPEACTHENQTTLPGKDATCTETGLTQGTACADCGETLVAQEVIPVVEHTEEMIPGKDATCTETGLTQGSKCSVCGNILTAQKPTPTIDHSFAEGVCTVCGAEDTGSSDITGYVLVTDISQILTGGQFIIVADNSGSYLALGTSTSGKIDPVAVTVAGNTVIGSDLPVWTLEATAAGVALNNGTSYLGYKSSTNFASSDTAYEWGVSAGSNGGFVLNSTSATRGIYYQISGGRFGAYAQSNADTGEYISGLQLYKYTQSGSETPDVPQVCTHENQTTLPGKDATCTETGLTQGTACADCGETLVAQEIIPASGHSYVDKICSVCGASGYIHIYFQNNWLWTDVCLHFWGSSLESDTQWPGTAMEYYGNDGMYDVYTLEIPADIKGIVINGNKADGSGADQTPDITGGWFDGVLYYLNWDNGNQVLSGNISDLGIQERLELQFNSASLTLYDDLTINFKVDQAVLDCNYVDVYAVFTLGGQTTIVREYTLKDGKYIFSFKNIAPYRMNDTVSAALYGTYSGTAYSSQVFEYSVATYCRNMLSKYSSDSNAKLRTLLVDLLNYGAASQLYVGYNTDTLVNSVLTEQQKAWATTDNRTWSSVQNSAFTTIEAPTAQWKGATLILKEAVTMRFKFTADSVEGLTVKVVTESGKQTLIDTFQLSDDGKYYFDFNGLNAAQMGETVYVTICNGDTAISNTASYSVESYAFSQQNSSNTQLVNLLQAMMKYGDAAKAYVG